VVATDDPNRLDWTFATDTVVSLDGQYLAYVAADDRGYTNATITVVDLTSGAKTVVARPGSSIWPLLRWSPDSRQLAYATHSLVPAIPRSLSWT
jgi:Tol biopolymer transport system component